MTESSHAVFLSYASEDAEAAQRIAEALRAASVEVWFDKSELRGGDAWDRQIREQIHKCHLFIPVISANSERRDEGYFRREWSLAVDRTRDMAHKRAFLVPVVIDGTTERGASVPEKFHELQWTRLPCGETPPPFVERVRRLLSPEEPDSSPKARPRPDPLSVAVAAPRNRAIVPRRTAVLVVIGAVVAVGLTYFAVDKFWLSKRATTATASAAPSSITSAGKSIAVLPFVDLSERHDQEYFGDGMAEEILDILAKIPQLTVIGRTSSFQFKGRTEDLRTIGGKLGAAYIVEGSVRKAGSRIRVTAQLIDTHSGAHVWSDSYDRDYGDVLTLQDEIATSIARALQLTIGAHEPRPLQTAQAIEAYTLYLKGKLALDKFEAKSLLEAENSFQQALMLDPTLLPAAEGLALTYLNRGSNENDIKAREAWKHARDAAKQALLMNASSATAHGVLGFIAGVLDFDWTTADAEFHKGLALNPNDPDTLANAGQISAMRGNFEEALQRLNASVTLDPLNATTYQVLGVTLYLKGDYTAAESALRKSLSINSEVDFSHYQIGLLQLVQGRQEEALKEFAADPEISNRDAGLALVKHALGRKAESDAALARLVKGSGTIWPYGVALVYAYRGENDQAFVWLERAYDVRDGDLTFVLRDPLLVPLHDDPRWSALMKKMNLATERAS